MSTTDRNMRTIMDKEHQIIYHPLITCTVAPEKIKYLVVYIISICFSTFLFSTGTLYIHNHSINNFELKMVVKVLLSSS